MFLQSLDDHYILNNHDDELSPDTTTNDLSINKDNVKKIHPLDIAPKLNTLKNEPITQSITTSQSATTNTSSSSFNISSSQSFISSQNSNNTSILNIQDMLNETDNNDHDISTTSVMKIFSKC